MVQSICGRETAEKNRNKAGVTICDGCDGILYIDADSENIVTIDATVTGDGKRLGCEGKLPAGRKTRLRVCTFVGEADRSAFALLLTKVTKHIPPQTSPIGLSLAGIWSAVGNYLCKTLYYNL